MALGLRPRGRGHGRSNYYQLRDLGQALGFNVCWDSAQGKAVIETDKPYDGKDR